MSKIIVTLCCLLLLGCADKPAVVYIHETTTDHCFKLTETKEYQQSEWTDCKDVPKGAWLLKAKEWFVEEGE